MWNEVLQQQDFYRLLFFIGGLCLFFFLGFLFHFRDLREIDRWRWVNNLTLVVLNSVLVKLLFPLTLVAFASAYRFGLFYMIGMPVWLNIIFSILLLDLVIYGQHVLFHYNSFLWKLHAVHHSDTSIDTTTALRFHPIEIIISVLVKWLAIILFGIHPVAVLVFEILLNFSAMFNHSNFSLPKGIEVGVSRLVVTPDFHRIHHSIIENETNSNFGFFLSTWDRLFRTAKENSQNDLKEDVIGLRIFRRPEDQRIDSLILQPFKKENK